MKTWYPIYFNPDTFVCGHMIYNHDTRTVEKYRGSFNGKWKSDVNNGSTVRVIVE